MAKFYKIDDATSAYSLVIEGKGEMGAIADLSTGKIDAWLTKVASGLNITEATICDGIENIGSFAFYMSSISNIQIASTVTEIGFGTFCECTKLTSIDLPDSITSIGDSAFARCSSLVSISMPNVTSIGFRAFEGCSNLTSIDMSRVTSIENSAFVGCGSLADVYYGGTAVDWGNVTIGNFNTYLTNATMHFSDGTTSKD